MKKMNKTYQAPAAEVIEMQMPTVLMGSGSTTTTGNASGSTTGGFNTNP